MTKILVEISATEIIKAAEIFKDYAKKMCNTFEHKYIYQFEIFAIKLKLLKMKWPFSLLISFSHL